MRSDGDSQKGTVKPGIPVWVLIADVIICLLLISVWVLCAYKIVPQYKEYVLDNIANVVTALATASLVVIGFQGVNTLAKTRYYPKLIGREELAEILENYAYDDANEREVYDSIRVMRESRTGDEFDSIYYDKANFLQLRDENFRKVWSDFCHYGEKKKLNDKEKKDFSELRKYIYYRIYEENKKG